MFFKIFLLLTFSLIASSIFTPKISAQEINGDVYEARVIEIKNEKEIEQNGQKNLTQIIIAELVDGDQKGKLIEAENTSGGSMRILRLGLGDNIYVTKGSIAGEDKYFVSDFVRRPQLYILFIVFALLTIFIAGKKGIYSMLGLSATFLILFFFTLPMLLAGNEPITIAFLSSIGIIFVSFYLTHGFNKKTTIAVLGTVITLIIIGVSSRIVIENSQLSGFATEEAGLLSYLSKGSINIQGLLLASIIIGMVGILDDITISQASIAIELKKANNKLTFKELYKKSMNVGKDHIASIVNTLVVVYTSASLPLLLLFINSTSSFSYVLNLEVVAEEIARTLLSSIGLIAAVPITTFIACFYISRKENLEEFEDEPDHLLHMH